MVKKNEKRIRNSTSIILIEASHFTGVLTLKQPDEIFSILPSFLLSNSFNGPKARSGFFDPLEKPMKLERIHSIRNPII